MRPNNWKDMTDKERRQQYRAVDPEMYRGVEDERTYTESEMRLERAAWQREAAAECDKRDSLPSEIQRRILAISTDQSALDRLLAEQKKQSETRLEKFKEESDNAIENWKQTAFQCKRGLDTTKAQTAAILEKAAEHLNRMKQLGRNPNEAWRQVTAICCESIKSFIPTDHAAALAEYVHDQIEVHDALRNKAEADRVRQTVREEAEWWVPLVPNGISSELERQRDERLAAHRAAAGAPEETKP